jgi:hypothetical protein
MSDINQRPTFRGGRNIAIKVPPHEWEKTVAFYKETLGLSVIQELPEGIQTVVFEFGSNQLWVDRVEAMSQAEIWLEVIATDISAGANHLKSAGVARRDEIEPLDFEGFWISSPAGIIHLVAGEDKS